MGGRTTIGWTDASWNTTRGCARVSDGCRNCYAEIMAARFSKPGMWGHGLAKIVRGPDGRADHRWTGKIELVEKALDLPLRWRKPRRIFVNSTSDLFHEDVPDEWIDRVFAVMALAPQHTFQILTKRPERMRGYLMNHPLNHIRITRQITVLREDHPGAGPSGLRSIGDAGCMQPLSNVWLGVSVEDQATADERIPILLDTPAAVRFVSAEPLLGPVDLDPWFHDSDCEMFGDGCSCRDAGGPFERTLDWVIVGGESGPGARPMHPDWARTLRNQCSWAGVAFFFKQWGEWVPLGMRPDAPLTSGTWAVDERTAITLRADGTCGDDGWPMQRVGTKAAGNFLDGRRHEEFPG